MAGRQETLNDLPMNSVRAELPHSEGLSQICTFCGLGEVESIIHLCWVCPRWTHIRKEIFDQDGDPFNNLGFFELPRCSQTCAVFNVDTNVSQNVIGKIQMMMVRIFRERTALQ